MPQFGAAVWCRTRSILGQLDVVLIEHSFPERPVSCFGPLDKPINLFRQNRYLKKGSANSVSENSVARKRILLAGGNGTLGYNTLRRLACDTRYDVTALVRNINAPSIADLTDKICFIEHDLNDVVYTAQIFERVSPELVVHCAASGMRPPRGS